MNRSVILTILLIIVATIALAGDIQGTLTAKGARNAANTVVYIGKIEGKTFSPPKEHAIMDQKNLTFIPHVLPVLKGTTVDFLNSDDVLHNVFTPDKCAEKFNLGTWAKGEIRSYTFKNSDCAAVLLCNVHPEMEAYVVVLDSPYFAVTKKDGHYVIKNVPAGKYSLQIWHEKLKGKTVEITVPEQGAVTQDFVIHR